MKKMIRYSSLLISALTLAACWDGVEVKEECDCISGENDTPNGRYELIATLKSDTNSFKKERYFFEFYGDTVGFYEAELDDKNEYLQAMIFEASGSATYDSGKIRCLTSIHSIKRKYQGEFCISLEKKEGEDWYFGFKSPIVLKKNSERVPRDGLWDVVAPNVEWLTQVETQKDSFSFISSMGEVETHPLEKLAFSELEESQLKDLEIESPLSYELFQNLKTREVYIAGDLYELKFEGDYLYMYSLGDGGWGWISPVESEGGE